MYLDILFQICMRLDYADLSYRVGINVEFAVGEWLHLGWSYYNGVFTAYKNGCLYQRKSTGWEQDYISPINAGILFGSESNITMNLQLDEVYFWEARKPASVFNALYIKDIEAT